MANKPQSGKGSGRRQEDFSIVQNNWDEIPNFGYKPRWMKELKSKPKEPNKASFDEKNHEI